MTLGFAALAHDAHDPARVARFWSELLERPVLEDARGFVLPATPTQVGLRFVPSDSVKTGVSDVHLHVTSQHVDSQQAMVDRALALGASHVDVGQLPDEAHVVLADPEGNELCVIEPVNNYLRDCGPLGELACDGLRATGVFWSRALDWPLIWDQDEETAIQAPAGGTKVAWGGPPLDPRHGPDRQRFELTGTADDVARLVELGATRVSEDAGVVDLLDPDRHEFCVVLT